MSERPKIQLPLPSNYPAKKSNKPISMICNYCNKQIESGGAFKCASCYDFNLCPSCFRNRENWKFIHNESHVFFRISEVKKIGENFNNGDPYVIPVPYFPTTAERVVKGFMAHPKDCETLVVKFSVNIIEQAKLLLQFLEKVDADNSLAIESNIAKYHGAFEMFLILKHKDGNVVAPSIEIDAIWKSYLIRPSLYKKLCLQLVGELIDHTMQDSIPKDAISYTLNSWKKNFKQTFEESVANPKSFLRKLNDQEIVQDRTWLPKFKNHVKKFEIELSKENSWNRLLKDYEKFLFLVAKYGGKEGIHLHPTVVVDILWHAHMCNPRHYIKDSLHIIETVIDHRPRPSYSNPEMNSVQLAMQKLWKTEFKEDLVPDLSAKDFTLVLPPPIVNEIFAYLDAIDLVAVSPVSKTFRKQANADELWKVIFEGKKKISAYPHVWVPANVAQWRAQYFSCLKKEKEQSTWDDMEMDCDESESGEE